MKPVFQTQFDIPANGESIDPTKHGDCFKACIASIFELPLDEIPYFVHHEDTWWSEFTLWCKDTQQIIPMWLHGLTDPKLQTYYIASVPSPRSTPESLANHEIVMKGSEVVHDPHPGYANIQHKFPVSYTIFLKLL